MEAGGCDHIRSPITTHDGWRASPWRALRTKASWIFSDQTLVLCARARDYTAFDALVARYRDRLYTMALGSLRNEDKAADALGEMMLTALKDINSFDAKCTPGAWLYLHGLRAVFKRMNVPPGRYTVESRPGAGAPSRDDDCAPLPRPRPSRPWEQTPRSLGPLENQPRDERQEARPSYY